MVRIKLVFIFLLLGTGYAAVAQTNRYMVFFQDKQGTGHSVDNPSTFLNERAIQRRITQNIEIIEEDLPVTAANVQEVNNTGAIVLFKTKWMNGVLVECTASQLTAINNLAFVASTEYVAPGGLPSGKRKKSSKLKLTETDDDVTTGQLTMLGIDEMHGDGFQGEGVIIAIMDGGFLGVNTAPLFQDIILNKFNDSVSYDFTAQSSNVFRYSEHGTSVLSVIGVQEPDVFTGGAYEANFQLYVTEDVGSEYRIEEYNWLFAAERADSAGADVINTSLGYNTFDDSSMDYAKSDMNGTTAVITRAAQVAASKGIVVVNSGGNSGNDLSWQIITAPADGKDVLAVGNININGARSSTSSTGPSADGRIKPDVVALGVGVSVIRSNGAIGSANGTSFSSPLVTALVAGLRQKYPELTSMKLIDAIRALASQAPTPDNFLGYGIPHYRAVTNYLIRQEQKDKLVIYPNPVTDTFTISAREASAAQVTSLAIVNTQGQVVLQSNAVYNWPDNTYTMNIGNLISGVYFLTVRVGQQYLTYKLVKL